MERLSIKEKLGEVFIRTKFGEQHESCYTLSPGEMILDDKWRVAVGAEGGPFCYTPAERLIPF